jgi:hypothetical protein
MVKRFGVEFARGFSSLVPRSSDLSRNNEDLLLAGSEEVPMVVISSVDPRSCTRARKMADLESGGEVGCGDTSIEVPKDPLTLLYFQDLRSNPALLSDFALYHPKHFLL